MNQALEFMLIDALLLANDYLQISQQVFSAADFWKVNWFLGICIFGALMSR
jgi:hypothetical protein